MNQKWKHQVQPITKFPKSKIVTHAKGQTLQITTINICTPLLVNILLYILISIIKLWVSRKHYWAEQNKIRWCDMETTKHLITTTNIHLFLWFFFSRFIIKVLLVPVCCCFRHRFLITQILVTFIANFLSYPKIKGNNKCPRPWNKRKE